MAGSSLQRAYVRLLMDRAQQEKHPNPEQLDRIERALRSPEELREYVTMLFHWVSDTNRPNPALLDRLERFVALQERAGRRAERA